MTVTTSYEEIIKTVESELQALERNIFETLEVSKTALTPDIKALISAPSKKIRPALVFLIVKALGDEITPEIKKIACALELLHLATLIHDDIVDKSEVRRNLTTLNYLYDERIAVLAGDYLLAISMSLIPDLEPELFQDFAKALREVCQSEINQYFQKFKMPTLEEYIEKSRQKTATLFALGLKAVFHRHPAFENIKEFAVNFGIAFQIRDDLLNVLNSDPSKGSTDSKNGIFTAAFIFEYENAIQNQKTCDIMSLQPSRFSIEKAKELLESYIKKASANLDFLVENEYKLALKELCNYLGAVGNQ